MNAMSSHLINAAGNVQ